MSLPCHPPGSPLTRSRNDGPGMAFAAGGAIQGLIQDRYT